MVKIERVGEVNDKSATEVYEAAVEAFEAEGFEVWKERPIAWLVMVRTTIEGCSVDGNLAARATTPTSYILTLTSEEAAEEKLAAGADEFIHIFEGILSV